MNLLNRVIGIITKPNEEWLVIKDENISTKQLFVGYVAILALIPVVAGFIGNFFTRFPVSYGLVGAIVTYIMTFVGIYLSAFIINMLAPNFESTKNMDNALKLVAFSYTPIWIGGIFNIIPSLSVLGSILGLYGLYLLYLGIEPMMATPSAKRISYLVVSLLVLFVVYIIIGAIVGAIIGLLMLGRYAY